MCKLVTDRYKSVGRAKKIMRTKREREKKQRALKNALQELDPQLKTEVNVVKQILSICCSLPPELCAIFLNDSIHISNLGNAYA